MWGGPWEQGLAAGSSLESVGNTNPGHPPAPLGKCIRLAELFPGPTYGMRHGCRTRGGSRVLERELKAIPTWFPAGGEGSHEKPFGLKHETRTLL